MDDFTNIDPIVHLEQNLVSEDNRSLEWEVEVLWGEEIWKRLKTRNEEGFDEPDRKEIVKEFFAKRQFYEVVGRLGIGRFDTGEFDFTSSTKKRHEELVSQLEGNQEKRKVWNPLVDEVHTAEEVREMEDIERQEATWVQEQQSKAIREGRRPDLD